jgi:hypothetical protein
MKLPVQAPAVVRESVFWPTRRPARGSTEPAIEPMGSVLHCTAPTPNPCVCENGIGTCCEGDLGCKINTMTGSCVCKVRECP